MVTVSGPLVTILAAPMPYRPKDSAPAGNGAAENGAEGVTDARCRGGALMAGAAVLDTGGVGGASVLAVAEEERW